MQTTASVSFRRANLLQRLFPKGVPALWCPSLTHYDDQGAIDEVRIAAHLRHLSPNVKGFLIPGSTGDGWELSNDEIKHLLQIAFRHAQALDLHLLIGVLKATAAEAIEMINETLDWLKVFAKESNQQRALCSAHVAGFTVCPPRGSLLSQEGIERGLSTILEVGVPTAIYQLPQVTQNEVSPQVIDKLAGLFENFVLFKDSSGADRVAASKTEFGGVFTLRGAEGEYSRWLKTSGGCYDGFLLSTANCFADELREIIASLKAGPSQKAEELSTRVSQVVKEVFTLVKDLPHGNAFANANKAIDHLFAFGPKATDLPPPRLHGGRQLPAPVIEATEKILALHGWMPAAGYLD